ncbi:hypothetical protein [Mariniblastus fucicola]|uniref:Uncharacterized protein n=1 Tax=Mariniblastus fucicola TaxID=980251 RepID=A0A5B9PFM8_9BACT|nr:hypothetical protein [Mariniblastus fucicola]QEG24359.1 hypothetical protein MFFC18_42780 [Mariniblastus fucicola]
MAKMLTGGAGSSPKFRLRLPPAESSTVLALLAGLLGLFAMRSGDFGLYPMLMLSVLFIGGVWSKRAWLIWMTIGILVFLTYFTARTYSGLRSFRPDDVVKALTLMLFAAASLRFLESHRFRNAFYPDAKIGKKPQSGIRFEFPSLLGGRWWAIPLALLLAALFLEWFPLERHPLRQFRIRPREARLIFITLMLFFAWFVCRSAIGMLVRWRMKPAQADVHCRSLVAKEFWRDISGFERRRAKLKSKDG